MPISPIQRVPKQGQGEGMGQASLDDSASIGAIKITAMDVVKLGICPVDLGVLIVYGQPIGPEDVVADNDFSGVLVSIHPSSLDFRNLPPVSPVDIPANTKGTPSSALTAISLLIYFFSFFFTIK